MKCSQCGAQVDGDFCPYCGATSETKAEEIVNEQPIIAHYNNTVNTVVKPQKPIYKKWWFWVIIVVVAINVFNRLGRDRRNEEIIWDDMVLGSMLPEPPANKGEINDNSADELWVYINDISDKQYSDYIEACKEKGFTVDAKSEYSSYYVYNAEGYKLELSHIDSMSIQLEKPMEMTTITWSTSAAGKQLPAPKSTTGKFSSESDDSFSVYVGNTPKTDYAEYVNACSKKGFNVDYRKGDDYYYADNSEGWHVSIRYEYGNIMSINISASSEDGGNS